MPPSFGPSAAAAAAAAADDDDIGGPDLPGEIPSCLWQQQELALSLLAFPPHLRRYTSTLTFACTSKVRSYIKTLYLCAQVSFDCVETSNCCIVTEHHETSNTRTKPGEECKAEAVTVRPQNVRWVAVAAT